MKLISNFTQIYSQTECKPGLTKCDPKSNDFCIASEFKDDDYQNCPPPYDERKNSKFNGPQNYRNSGGRGTSTGAAAKNIIEFELLIIPAFIAFLISNIL